MTRYSLHPGQRRLLAIIEGLYFGRIEGLAISNGDASFARPPRILEEIRLASQPERGPEHSDSDALKKPFAVLFTRLSLLCDGMVDIVVQHYLPFTLIIDRNTAYSVDGGKNAVGE